MSYQKTAKKFSLLAVAAISVVIFSCASTPGNEEQHDVVPVVPPVIKEPSPIEKFNDVWADKRIAVIDAPKEIVNGKEFASPYIVKVSKTDGSAIENLEIEISYPVSRIGEEVTFEKTVVKTKADGTAEFMPAKPDRPYHSEVLFAPHFDAGNDAALKEAITKKTVKAPYRVKTNMQLSGGSIAIVDFNAAGAAITSNTVSSSNLLMNLMSKGFKGIGNAEFTSAIASGNDQRVYKEAKEFFGNNVAFLIFGTVKYVSPVTKENDVYTCVLKGEITAYNMKTGALLTKAVREVTCSDPKEWNCLPNARKLLAEELSEAIVYGL